MQQTVGILPVAETGAAYRKPDGTQRAKRSKQKKTDYGAQRRCNSFLKTTIVPIAPQVVTSHWQEEGHNYVTVESYRYLHQSATKYASLLGTTLKHHPGKSIGEGISNLYDELDGIIGDINLNMEPNGELLEFVLWKYHTWSEYTFYWLPVKFTESLNPRLRKIALSFISRFKRSNGMDTTNAASDVGWMLELIKNELDECSSCDRKEYKSLIKSYESGKIHRLMKRIDSVTYYKNLPAVLERYVPNNEFERNLTNLFKEGLQFIGKDKPSIMSYAYDPLSDMDRDYPPVDMDRLIRIIYDVDDKVSEWMTDWTNNELRESYDISPVTRYALSPDTGILFSMDDYPERFSVWFDKLCTLIS